MDAVYMNVPEIRNVAKNFGEVSDLLTHVESAMSVLVSTIQNTALVGDVNEPVVAHFNDTIKPQIKQLAEICAELSRDVDASVSAYENGDQEGATRFY